MMIVVIITVLVVVALLYFAWDEISAARATKKKFSKVWKGFEHYWDDG
jgi:heme/copper-type cytochrome/quinol oxidase subunit 2